MDSELQVQAYANADFSEPHQQVINLYAARFGHRPARGWVLDLGCGTGDITLRFAYAFPRCRLLQGIDAGPNMLRYARAAVDKLDCLIESHCCKLGCRIVNCLAAYTPNEVQEQLEIDEIIGLTVDVPSDRHPIVHGSLEKR